MTLYRAGLAIHSDACELVVFDLPGCRTDTPDRDEACDIAPVIVSEHLAWLARHDLPAPGDLGGIQIVEEIRVDRMKAADGEFCFDDDLTPLTREELEAGIAVMTASRNDLAGLLSECPGMVLDWRPPMAAMARIDEWKPHPLTIAEIADDIAGAESYYRTALGDGPQKPGTSSAPPQLDTERVLLVDTMRSLTSEDLGRRFEPQRAWQSSPEHWTARKVIRRVIGHERFHTAEIRQRLSWLLLGVPRFRE
jgi:hypothetical protein